MSNEIAGLIAITIAEITNEDLVLDYDEQWIKHTESYWESLVPIGYWAMDNEEVQLFAIARSDQVFHMLQNPTEKAKRLHAMKWKI